MKYHGIHKVIVFGATNILFISSLILWGGIGRFDAVDGPEIAGLLRWQDLLAFISAFTLCLYFIRSAKVPKWFFIIGGLTIILIVYGVLMGIANGNNLQNIALEVRPFVYLFYGLITVGVLTSKLLEKHLIFYATLVATAIILQFTSALIFGPSKIFITGTHMGNAFSQGLPFVRPQAIHLVMVGFVLGLALLNKLKYSSLVLIFVIALVISQSKTYWLFAILFMTAFFLFSKRITVNRKVIIVGIFILTLTISSIFLSVLPNSSFGLGAFFVKKISEVFTSSDISYGVVGVRLEESKFLIAPIVENPQAIVYGHGLGYIYRDVSSLFHREAARDQQVLAMFGHNYYLWMLLKLGIFGVSLFFSLLILPVLNGIHGSERQQIFTYSFLALLISAVFLGTFENPLGGFLLGLLMGGAMKSRTEVY